MMNMQRLSGTEVEYVGRHSGRWADFIRLEVREDADGWKVLRVIKHEARRPNRPLQATSEAQACEGWHGCTKFLTIQLSSEGYVTI